MQKNLLEQGPYMGGVVVLQYCNTHFQGEKSGPTGISEKMVYD